MKKKLFKKLAILIAIIVILSSLSIGGGYIKTAKDREATNIIFPSNPLKSSDGIYYIGQNFFNSTGSNLNVTLFSLRNNTFTGDATNDGGITIINNKLGWNISKFNLNFTSIEADEKHVKFQTRIDGAESFKVKGVLNPNRSYATSFQVPNTCILKNISTFLQYPGGRTPAGNIATSSFNITIYNCTSNEPDSPIHNLSEDQIQIDLSSADLQQPASWYTSNFSDRILNISKTYNRTFFAVFHTIDYPDFGFYTPNTFMYYAEKQKSDAYNMNAYLKLGNLGNWNIIENKTGLLKVNLAPINTTPSANEINLTVFNTLLDENYYENTTFFEHKKNEFFIPITSSWFGEVRYDVAFEGNFQYNTFSSSKVRAIADEEVQWNLTLSTDKFETDSYNNSALFYYPDFWSYNTSYNGTLILDGSKVSITPDYVELLDISNNINWNVNFNHTNNIINTTLYSSESLTDWEEFTLGNTLNAYHNVNVSAQCNSSQGDILLYVYTDNQLDLELQQELTGGVHYFPIWSPRYNTSMNGNTTSVQLMIITNNGTMAGIVFKTINIELIKSSPALLLTDDGREAYLHGEFINVGAILTSGENPLAGEPVMFIIITEYANGVNAYALLEINTNNLGVATISFPVGEAKSVKTVVSYAGNLDFTSTAVSTSEAPVRSPTLQFFLDFLPLFIAILAAIIALITYLSVKRYKFKQNMKKWKKTTALFSDILKVDLILIIHKEVGVAIVKQNYTREDLDGDLISGFLQAISSFKYEIKKASGVATRESMILDYKDYKILLEDGKFIRFALVLNSEPSDNLKQAQFEFIGNFEARYYKHLKGFSGDITPFEDAEELVNKNFNMSIVLPHVVNRNPPPISINSFQENILSVAKTLEQDTGQIYISTLLNYLISAMPNEPKERIIASVFELEEKDLLKAV